MQLQFDLYITFLPEDGKSRWKIAQRALRVRHFSEIDTSDPLHLFGNIEFKPQLALLSLPKSFRESWSRTNKTSYASNSVYFEWAQLPNRLRLSVNRTHRNALGLVATNVKLNLLVKSKINVQLQFDLYITFLPEDGKSRWKIAQRALRVRHFSEIDTGSSSSFRVI